MNNCEHRFINKYTHIFFITSYLNLNLCPRFGLSKIWHLLSFLLFLLSIRFLIFLMGSCFYSIQDRWWLKQILNKKPINFLLICNKPIWGLLFYLETAWDLLGMMTGKYSSDMWVVKCRAYGREWLEDSSILIQKMMWQ